MLSQMNAVQTFTVYLSKIRFIVMLPLLLELLNGLLLSGFPTKTLYAFLNFPFVLHPHPSHPERTAMFVLFLIVQISPPHFASLLLGS
jgi:hypothetical protein